MYVLSKLNEFCLPLGDALNHTPISLHACNGGFFRLPIKSKLT